MEYLVSANNKFMYFTFICSVVQIQRLSSHSPFLKRLVDQRSAKEEVGYKHALWSLPFAPWLVSRYLLFVSARVPSEWALRCGGSLQKADADCTHEIDIGVQFPPALQRLDRRTRAMHAVTSILTEAWHLKARKRALGPALSASKCVPSAFYQRTIGKERVEFFVAPVTEFLATGTCLTAVNFSIAKHISSTFTAECEACVLRSAWQESQTDCALVRLFGVCVLTADFVPGREKCK